MNKYTNYYCNNVAKMQNKLIYRLFETLKKEGVSVPVFSIETGIPKDRVYKWKQQGTNPKSDDEKIILNWLHKVPHETIASEPKASYLKTRQDIKNSVRQGIPIYEAAPVTLTSTPSIRDERADGPDFWVTIPNLRDCNYGTRCKGDSMHPLIRTNALVIGREITDMKVIIFGEIYIILTKGGIETVKYIHPHDSEKDIILLVPYNNKAKVTPVHKSDILKLYEAKAVFNTI